MRLLGSFLFLVGALSVGAYAYFPHVVSTHPNLMNIVEIEAPSAREGSTGGTMREGSSQARSFSPLHAGFRQVAEAGSLTTSAPDTTPDDSTQTAVGGGAWQTNVTVVAGDGDSKRRSSMTPGDWNERVELARSLQSELKRVGCYAGNLDGDWGGASKRAMTSFLQKVNATLPVEAPDYILLTLIQGHADKACGTECPSSQGMSGDGRCVSNVIVAQGPGRGSLLARKTTGEARGARASGPQADKARPSTTTAVAVADAKSELAMPAAPAPRAASGNNPPLANISVARAAPAPVASAAAARTTAQPASRQTVAAAIPDSVPAPAHVAAAAPLATPFQPAEIRAPVAPLPGRMAVGAPIPSEAELAASSANNPPQPALAEPYVAPRQITPRGMKNAALSNLAKADADQATAPPSAAPGAVIATPKPKRAASRPRIPNNAYARPAPVREHRSSGRRNDFATVRTSQGKVRRGSPTHNLMLSLGGVF